MPSSVSLGNTVEEIDGMAIGGPLSSDRVESSHAKSVLLDNVRFKVEWVVLDERIGSAHIVTDLVMVD